MKRWKSENWKGDRQPQRWQENQEHGILETKGIQRIKKGGAVSTAQAPGRLCKRATEIVIRKSQRRHTDDIREVPTKRSGQKPGNGTEREKRKKTGKVQTTLGRPVVKGTETARQLTAGEGHTFSRWMDSTFLH